MSRSARRWMMRIIVALLVVAFGIAGYVVPQHVAIGKGFDACSSLVNRDKIENCIASKGASYVQENGVPALARRVDQLATQNWFGANCHQAMHRVATPLGRKVASHNHRLTTVSGNSTCVFGLAHGLMIGYLETARAGDLHRFSIANCPTNEKSAELDFDTCTHSVGHAMFKKGVSDTEAAGICSRLSKDVARRSSVPASSSPQMDSVFVECVGGMMMERTFKNRSRADTCPRLGTDPDQLRYTDACVAYLPINMVQADMDIKRVARACIQQSRNRRVLDYCASAFAEVAPTHRDCRLLDTAAQTCALVRKMNGRSV